MNLSPDFILALLGRQTAVVAALEQDLARAQQRISELEEACANKPDDASDE